MKIEFSCLIPVYVKDNAVNFKLALNSILKQSYPPSEIVIVKDGILTTELDNVINDCLINNPSQKFIIKELSENVGMGRAMNIGLNLCSYEWVARMDSDDIARHDRFKKQVDLIIRMPNIDVIGGNIEEFMTNVGDSKRVKKMPQTHKEIINFMKYRNPINHMTVMFKRELAIKAGGYWDNRVFEDYNLWYSMFTLGSQFANVNEILVDVRIDGMEKRRRGYKYFKIELVLFKKMYKHGFINTFEFWSLSPVRFLIRMLPANLLKDLYKIIFRN